MIGRRRVRLAVLAALALPACFPRGEVSVTDAGFVERLRLDHQSLDARQASQDPRLGTFRTGASELVAEVYPLLPPQRAADNLTLADCLWVGQDSQTANGDTLHLSWEVIMLVDPTDGDVHKVHADDRDWAMCRLNDPETRQPPTFGEFPAGQPPAVGGVTHQVSSLPSASFPIATPVEGPSDVVEEDLHLMLGVLRERTSHEANPYGECPVEPFKDDPRPVIPWNCPTGEHDGRTTVSLCGVRCAVQPTRDTTYEVGAIGLGRFLRPNVMVVDRARSIARPADLAGATARWNTPVAATPDDEGRVRWAETFTPTVRVRAVRFFRPAADGSREYLGGFAQDLCVLATPGSSSCRWTCTAGADVQGVPFFDLESMDSCRNADGDPDTPRLTPTYDTDLHVAAAGNPVPGPLRWSVELSTAPAQPVFIEFALKTVFGGAALTAAPAVMDFGQMQRGGVGRGWASFTNVGVGALRVDALEILPSGSGPTSHPEEYERFPAHRPKPVPVPVDFTPAGEGRGRYSVSQGKDYGLWPLVTESEGPGFRLFRPPRLDRQEVDYYGYPVQMRAGIGFYSDPKADFQRAAAQWSPAWRPFSSLVFLDRALPVVLRPGESLDVLVTARPAGLDSRQAFLRATARPLDDPSQVLQPGSALRAHGILGPTMEFMPRALWLPRNDSPSSPERRFRSNILIGNAGHVDMTRGTITFAGPDAGRFQLANQPPASRVIAPGQSELVTVAYRPRRCADPAPPPGTWHSARLLVSSNGGGADVALTGDANACEP